MRSVGRWCKTSHGRSVYTTGIGQRDESELSSPFPACEEPVVGYRPTRLCIQLMLRCQTQDVGGESVEHLQINAYVSVGLKSLQNSSMLVTQSGPFNIPGRGRAGYCCSHFKDEGHWLVTDTEPGSELVWQAGPRRGAEIQTS